MFREQKNQTITKVSANIINMPDLQFVRWCEKQFSINRGIYNLIDERLYEHGYYVITERRLHLILFLQSISRSNESLKFGHGNLSKALQQFLLTKGGRFNEYCNY